MSKPQLDETTVRGFCRIWIDYTVEVQASPSELYAQLRAVDAWPSWTPGLRAITRDARLPLSIGTAFTMVLAMKPLPFNLYLPCKLFVDEPTRVEWGGGIPGSLIRHRFELSPGHEGTTRLRHVEYATNLLALLTLPFEKAILAHDRTWSDAIRAQFAGRKQPQLGTPQTAG